MGGAAVRGEFQRAGTNQATGAAGDLSGERGIVIVTAYEPEVGSLGEGCHPRNPVMPVAAPALVGSWTSGDTLETRLALPSVCFDGVGFGTMKPDGAAPDQTPLLPPSASVDTAGALELTDCVTASDAGQPAPLGQDRPQFLFAFHGQTVGPFGVAASGTYAP